MEAGSVIIRNGVIGVFLLRSVLERRLYAFY